MKQRYVYQTVLLGIFVLALSLWCWLRPHDAASESERRTLAQFPALTTEALFSGSFMSDFETATLDQFPARDTFRGFKSAVSLYLLGNLDTNGLYTAEGHIAKSDYPLSPAMLDIAAEKFAWLHDTYLQDSNAVYLSIIPDKHHFLADGTPRLAADFDAAVQAMRDSLPQMTYLPIDDLLSAEDYYRTDSHWKQECLQDIADRLAAGMGASLDAGYETRVYDAPFYGVYKGQLALPAKPDTIRYLTNDTLEGCTVTSWKSGKAAESAVYDLAPQRDAYDLFLGGADPLIVIENPDAATDRELILFRDSYGSSLAPLLVDGYAKVTLIDIRYIQSAMLGNLIDFSGSDVLFLYSTTMLGSATAFK